MLYQMQPVVIKEEVYEIVMSVIDIKRKSIHIGMLTAMGVIVAGIRVVQSVCGTAKLNKYELMVITGLTLVISRLEE